MWFKNAIAYRVTTPAAELLAALPAISQHAFTPCEPMDPFRFGFIPPVPGGTDFIHQANGTAIFATKLEEKIIPTSVIRQKVNAKVESISRSENRPVGRKERDEIKDTIIFEMLPKAFSKVTITYGIFDSVTGLLIIDSASRSRAEDVCSKIREALGSLRCLPLCSKGAPVSIMTTWVKAGTERPIILCDSAVLENKDGGTVRVKNIELESDQILRHLHNGMHVSAAQIVVEGNARFMLNADLSLKRIKFDDAVVDKANEDNAETLAQQFDADFVIMSEALRTVFTRVVIAMGGLEEGQ